MVLQGLYHLWELVRDVQFVGVKQQYDPVHSLCKPLQDSRKVIAWEDTEEKERKGEDPRKRLGYKIKGEIKISNKGWESLNKKRKWE